jgi:hypothetical protein
VARALGWSNADKMISNPYVNVQYVDGHTCIKYSGIPYVASTVDSVAWAYAGMLP